MASISAESPLGFKFRYLNEQGQETGFFRKNGSFNGEDLQLDDVEIPVAAIIHVEVRENRMAITVMTEDGSPTGVAIGVSGVATADLQKVINASRSATWAEHHQQKLIEEGRGHEFRVEECPICRATIILSGMPPSPQLYCNFCESLVTVESPQLAPADETGYKLCDECGMFSKPRKYTIFYFYFLLVVYGFSQRTVWRCPGCMRSEAWKMLLGNLLFVIGIIPSIIQLIRSYGGSVSGPFAGLDDANIRARKGRVAEALKGYEGIMERVPYCAGVKYNIGLGLLQQNDYERASQTFELALDDCANYAPAYGALVHCYESLGEDAKLADLRHQWDDAQEDDAPEEQQQLE